MAEEGDRRDRKSEGGKDKEMKKPILTLGMVLALAAALFVPAAVMASDTIGLIEPHLTPDLRK